MKAALIPLQVTVRVRPMYTCVDCYARAAGDTATLETTHNPGDLNRWLHSCSLGNNHMPVGWAGYGIDTHRCPDCAK